MQFGNLRNSAGRSKLDDPFSREYSAYVAAETLSFEDALKLVSLRAKYMQQAVPEGEGGIAAIWDLTEAIIFGMR